MTKGEIIEQLESIIGTYEILTGNGVNSDILEADDIEAIQEAIEALKAEPCEDCISRQAVLEVIRKCHCEEWVKADIGAPIEALPSVTPAEKVGQWIQTNEFFINQDGQFIYKFICSECKSLSYFRKSNKKAIGANVCPNCGAKMKEDKNGTA